MRRLFPRVTGDVKAAAVPIARILYLCLAQAALMVAATVLVTHNKGFAQALYRNAGFLADYLPVLWRYRAGFARLRREQEFVQIFGCYASYLAIHLIFFAIIAVILLRHVDFRPKAPRLGIDWGMIGLLLFSLGALLEFSFGPYDVTQSRLSAGSYGLGLYIYCMMLPGANFLFGLVIYSAYATAMRRLTPIPFEESKRSPR